MNIFQFLRIFWARRLLIVAATVSCFVGAMIVVALQPPIWEAHSRVILDTLKPDPVTGLPMGGSSAHTYVSTQVELITDYSVAGEVAEQLGWLTDPGLIHRYQSRPRNDQRDFRRWLADIVIANTKASLIQDSNILEISYATTSQEGAKAVAEALRKAYIDVSIKFRREDAEHNAVWFQGETEKARSALEAASATLANFERVNGLIMAGDKLDSESARLRALAQQSAPIIMPSAAGPTTSPADMQLAALDADIATAAKTLGPNNPELQNLYSKRSVIAAVAARDHAAAAANRGGSGAGALAQEFNDQKNKVIAKSDKITRLTELQQDVDLRQDEYIKDSAKLAEFRQQALVADSALTPLGPASSPSSPKFPKYTLIIPGCLALGIAVSVLVALLMELIGHRVRGLEDLQSVEDIDVVAVIPAAGTPARKRSLARSWFPKAAKQGAVGA